MGNYLHRTTKVYLKSIPYNELPEPLANYISMPDLSAVSGVPSKYWVITGDIVTEMNQGQKDSVDAAILVARRDSAVDGMIEDVEGNLRQLVKVIIYDLNILRTFHGLPDRTMAQFKTQIRNGYGS